MQRMNPEAGRENDPSSQGPRTITLLSSFVHKSEHHAFWGVVCGYLGFEGVTEKAKKERKTNQTRAQMKR
jgi:hypothetical protein